MTTKKVRIGGSFAPPLDDDKLSRYEELAAEAPESIGVEMTKLIEMMRVFRETPDSTRNGTRHPSGMGLIVPLEDDEVKRIWDHVPWGDEGDDHVDECAVLGRLFDKIDPVAQKELRDAAFHLLWHARELAQDREPMTSDKL